MSRLRRGHRDDGVALVELALILPLLIILSLGIIEFGFLWGDVSRAERSSQNSARSASGLGNQRFADYEALRSVESSLTGLDGATLVRAIVYRSNTEDGAVPAGCLAIAATGTAPKGVAGVCNVYSPQQVTNDNPGNFGSPNAALDSCLGSAWDSAWCPTGRSRQSSNPDYLGVFVEVRYEGRTSVIPGSLSIEKRSVYQVEPCKAGEITC